VEIKYEFHSGTSPGSDQLCAYGLAALQGGLFGFVARRCLAGKNMVQAMPMWLLVLSVVAVTALVLNPLTLRTLLGGAVFLLVVYFIVRQAVRDEHRRLNRVQRE
jgi:hypothetical protein